MTGFGAKTITDAAIRAALDACLSRLVAGRAPATIPRHLRYHGLSTVTAALAASGMPTALKPAQVRAIRRDALAYTAQALAWQAEWRQLLGAQREIPILVLKGAALAHTLYPRPQWRMMGDLDLLIEPRQRGALEAGLRDAGYVPTLSTGGDLLFSEQQYVRQLGPGLQSRVDLHWALSNRPALGAWSPWPQLWANAVALPALKAHGLGIIDALLQACVHRTGHHRRDGDRLIWLLDIHLLWVALGPSGQAAALATARTKGLSALLGDALDATCAWFDTEVAGAQRDQLRSAGQGEASARLLSTRPAAWQDLITLPDWRRRFRYLGQLLFPPRAYMQRRYGRRSPLAWLYFSRCWHGLRKMLPR